MRLAPVRGVTNPMAERESVATTLRPPLTKATRPAEMGAAYTLTAEIFCG